MRSIFKQAVITAGVSLGVYTMPAQSTEVRRIAGDPCAIQLTVGDQLQCGNKLWSDAVYNLTPNLVELPFEGEWPDAAKEPDTALSALYGSKVCQENGALLKTMRTYSGSEEQPATPALFQRFQALFTGAAACLQNVASDITDQDEKETWTSAASYMEKRAAMISAPGKTLAP